MRVLKWLLAAFLVWGLFTGILYAIAPLVSDRGNLLFVGIGVGLILGCGLGLLRLFPSGSAVRR